MARSQFSYTAVAADVANTVGIGAPIKALENVEYNVYKVDSSGNRITSLGQRPSTYASRTSATDLGYSGTTDADGVISFWLDPGEYEIEIEDTNTPARISARTITWSSLAATDGSISGDYVSNDAQLDLPTLGDDILRQLVPVGTVLDWWRPANSGMNVPSGFVICDGSQYSSSQHDFPGGGTVTVPDLRNKFILGASISKNDNVDATAGPLGTLESDPNNAPGIGGKGGTNALRNLTHTHTISGHNHNLVTGANRVTFNNPSYTFSGNQLPEHGHFVSTGGAGSHIFTTTVGAGFPQSNRFGADSTSNSKFPWDGTTLIAAVSNTAGTPSGSVNLSTGGSIGGKAGPADGSGIANGDAEFTSGQASANITNSHDFRPSYYGLLKIIKIKRA